MSRIRRLAPAGLALLALAGTGCGGDGGGTEAAAPRQDVQGAERRAAAPQPVQRQAASRPQRAARSKPARRSKARPPQRPAASRRVPSERVLRRAKSPTARTVESAEGALVVGRRPHNAPQPASPRPAIRPQDAAGARDEQPSAETGTGGAAGGQDASGDSGFLG